MKQKLEVVTYNKDEIYTTFATDYTVDGMSLRKAIERLSRDYKKVTGESPTFSQLSFTLQFNGFIVAKSERMKSNGAIVNAI